MYIHLRKQISKTIVTILQAITIFGKCTTTLRDMNSKQSMLVSYDNNNIYGEYYKYNSIVRVC